MATTRKKTTKKEETVEKTAGLAPEVKELAHELVEKAKEKKIIKSVEEVKLKVEPIEEKPVKKTKIKQEQTETPVKKQKFNVGDIVFVNRNASVDLNGFKLFPQYKKYTYTVEAYDENTGVYTLRRLNLSLKLKEELILAPSERAHDPINRRQF